MKINPAGLAIIREFESCKLIPYPDPNGIPTVGYGHTQGVTMDMGPISKDTAERWLMQDVAVAEGAVEDYVDILLNENQFSALVSLCFNIGSGNFRKSHLLKYVNAGYLDPSQDPNVADEFLAWIYSGGKPLKGLKERRLAERQLFLIPVIVSSTT